MNELTKIPDLVTNFSIFNLYNMCLSGFLRGIKLIEWIVLKIKVFNVIKSITLDHTMHEICVLSKQWHCSTLPHRKLAAVLLCQINFSGNRFHWPASLLSWVVFLRCKSVYNCIKNNKVTTVSLTLLEKFSYKRHTVREAWPLPLSGFYEKAHIKMWTLLPWFHGLV